MYVIYIIDHILTIKVEKSWENHNYNFIIMKKQTSIYIYFTFINISFLMFLIFLGYAVHLQVFSNCCKCLKDFPIYLLKKVCRSVDLHSSKACCSRLNCSQNHKDLKLKWLLPRAVGRGELWHLTDIKFHFHEMKRVMGMNGANACTIMWLYINTTEL